MQTGCAVDAVGCYLVGRAVTRRRLIQHVLGTSAVVLAAACSPPAPAPTQAQPITAVASASALATSSGVSSAAGSGAPEKLTLAYTAATVSQLAPMIAKEVGYFAQNGLDVDVVSIGAGSQPQAALLANQFQLYEGGPEVISAAVAGADTEFVGAAETAFLFYLYGDASIQAPADLKGKKIAVTSLASSTYTGARYAVQSLGLNPDGDVSYIAANNPAAILAAMESGAVQAGMIGPTNVVQVNASGKFHVLVDLTKLNLHFPAGWWAVTRSWANSHDSTMQRLARSLVQAIAYMVQQPTATQQVLATYAKTNDQAFLTGDYDIESPHLQKTPYAEADGVSLALQSLAPTNPKANTADPNSFIDNHWVKALADSGFISSLYQAALHRQSS